MSRHIRLHVVIISVMCGAIVATSARQAWALGSPVLVKEIQPGSSGSEPHGFVQLGNLLYFAAADTSIIDTLWKTDGTGAGTIKVSSAATCVSHIVNMNGTLFFAANDDGCVENNELWKSNGTTGGTVLVKNIESTGFDFGSYPDDLTNLNGTLYFSAFTSGSGRELWKSTGTDPGTVQVKEINPGTGSARPSGYAVDVYGDYDDRFFVLGSQFFFDANDGTSGRELWVSNGSTLGTARVRDINVGAGSALTEGGPQGPVALNATTIVTSANDGTGFELWRSDGTFAGTTMIQDIRAGAGSDPSDLVNVGGTIYFSANDGITGRELWRTDGAAVTVRITDLNSGAGDSLVYNSNNPPARIAGLNGEIYFAATDGVSGLELWKTNGTTAGTSRVKDINPGAAGSAPDSLTIVNQLLYFTADDGTHGREVWVSDGTDAGTTRLTDINASGDGVYYATDFVKLGGKLLFQAMDTGSNLELWSISLCGDGALDLPDEACDDGAANGTDGCCSSSCTLIDGDGDKACDALDNCSAIANPDQRNTDGATEPLPKRGDLCDVCPADAGNRCDTSQSGAGSIGATGGTVTTVDGPSVTFPAGAISNRCNDAGGTPCTTDNDCFAVGATKCGPVSVAITGGMVGSSYGSGNNSSNYVGGIAEFTPEGATFAQDVTITFPWSNPDNDAYVNNPSTGANTAVRVADLKVFRNGDPLGTCAMAPQTLCSASLPCAGGANCNVRTCSQQGCPVGSALCCDVANNHWVVKVRTFSEYAAGLEPCIAADAKLHLSRIAPPPGDDKLNAKGVFTRPSDFALSDIDPLTHGLDVILYDDTGTLVDALLPAGAFDGTQGWKVNSSGKTWKYLNKSVLAPGGIVRASIQAKTANGVELVKFQAKGANGVYTATTAAAIALVFPDAARCVEATFPGPDPVCTLNSTGSTLNCK